MNKKLNILFIISALLLVPIALAQPTGLVVPHQFFGDVVINGEPAPNGLEIEARVNGQLYGATFTSGGTYGYNPNIFYVEYQGSDGAQITFFIEGQQVATRSFQSGQSTRLDFDAEIEGISPGDDSAGDGSDEDSDVGDSGDDSSEGSDDSSADEESGSSTGTSTSRGSSRGGGTIIIPGTASTEENDSQESNATSDDGSFIVVDSCESNWICTQWTECVNNVQRRTCIDTNECEDESTKPDTTRSCEQTPDEILASTTPEEPSSNFITGLVTGLGDGEYSSFALYGLLLALLIGMLIFFVFRKKKK